MAEQAGAAPQGAATSGGGWVDPYRDFNFKLEIQGVTEGHFAECSGLEISIGVIVHREGGNSQVSHRIPGAVDHAPVTLQYGLTKSTDLWTWVQKLVHGEIDRRNVSIVMLETDGVTEAFRWNLINAWPCGWRAPPLNARGKELAIETLTLAYETLERG